MPLTETYLRQTRDAVREQMGITQGGCSFVTEVLSVEFDELERIEGCYLHPDGSHILHLWNRLPDGTIIDPTADQFGEGDDIRVTSANDPRYIRSCWCVLGSPQAREARQAGYRGYH